MSAVFTTRFTSDPNVGFPLTSLAANGGVWSPASPISPASPQQRLIAAGIQRASIVITDIFIVSDAAHDLNLFYRPDPVLGLPSGPGFATNDTLIYAYVGRTNVNPFHEDDDSGRRLKTLHFGESGNPIRNSAGTLQFQVPAFAGSVKVFVQWMLDGPGGGYAH